MATMDGRSWPRRAADVVRHIPRSAFFASGEWGQSCGFDWSRATGRTAPHWRIPVETTAGTGGQQNGASPSQGKIASRRVHGGDEEANEIGASIPEENACGWEIEIEETREGPAHDQRHGDHVGIVIVVAHDREREAEEHAEPGRQAIHAIDKDGRFKVVAVNGSAENSYWLWEGRESAPTSHQAEVITLRNWQNKKTATNRYTQGV